MKHGSGITLLLLGHKAGTTFPVYQSGSVLNGMVVLAKPAGVASLDVKVRDLQLPSCPAKTHFCVSWKDPFLFERSKEVAGVVPCSTRTS